MKWITKDYKGNEQIWYSGDILKEIKEELTPLNQYSIVKDIITRINEVLHDNNN